MRSVLEVQLQNDRSTVTRNRSVSPLRVVTPENHGHAAWAYQSSYGGGFVGTDDIDIELSVLEGATLYLSSQASAKVYRKTDAKSSLRATVEERATLISWPDPIVCFAGASLTQTQSFALGKDANLLAVDAWTAGRVASGERWQFDRLTTRLEVTLEDQRIFTDAVRLSSREGDLAARMGPMNAFATVVLVGAKLQRALVPDGPHTVVSDWPWGHVLRVAAPTTEALNGTLRNLLQTHVAQLLGDDPLARKW